VRAECQGLRLNICQDEVKCDLGEGNKRKRVKSSIFLRGKCIKDNERIKFYRTCRRNKDEKERAHAKPVSGENCFRTEKKNQKKGGNELPIGQ